MLRIVYTSGGEDFCRIEAPDELVIVIMGDWKCFSDFSEEFEKDLVDLVKKFNDKFE